MGEPLIDVGSAIAMVSLAISVITLYLNQRKAKKELKLTKIYIQILSQLVSPTR